MTITFILPAIGKKPGEKYIGTWKMEPLTIALLKALTPPEIETRFFDDRIECIDYEAATDLVAITTEAYTARRAYAIAGRYRARGAAVVFGGYHATALPEEALRYGDAVITGNAEGVWGRMLRDFSAGRLQKRYDGRPLFTDILPDKSIFAGKKYLPVTLVETGRGCCNACEFCSISSYYRRCYLPRPHENILSEVERSGHKYHFLVDDNLVADQKNAMALFEKLTPYRIKWAGQETLSMAKDPALLKRMKRSGCELILIGFESLDEGTLRRMNKSVNLFKEERDTLVRRIHDAGIGIYATFLFGYDGETKRTFDRTVEFALRHRFYTAAFNHLLPFPATPLYDRLEREGRLLYPKWWLQEGYHYGELAFRPAGLPPERVSELCRQARKQFASPGALMRRGFSAMGRSSPLMWGLFWGMNLRLGEEIDEKMHVPIGENLDERPK